jgi:hypothetical protein
MPTYTNATGAAAYVESTTGLALVQPGASVQTYQVLGTGWTKTAATPYYNPVAALETVTASGAGSETVDIELDTVRIVISNVSGGGVTPYIDAAANTPALHAELTAGDVLTIDRDGNITSLVLVFADAGSCVVKQLSE